jgi:hypothetical protein
VSLARGGNRLDTAGNTSSLRNLRLVRGVILSLGSRNTLKRRLLILSCCCWWALVLLVR